MELRLLGPIELWFDERRVDAGPAKQRCVLAVLGLSAGTEVAVDTLIDRVWGEMPPTGVRNVLYTHIARLRRLMADNLPPGGEVPLRRNSSGYVLDLDRDQIDVHLFEATIAAAQRIETDKQRLKVLREALGLWRGAPLSGIASEWADSTRSALEQSRLNALTERADLELRGHAISSEFLEEIRGLVAEHPFEERLAGRLMLALCRNGRPGEALKIFERIRRRLADELGHDPSVELQRLHQQILHQDPVLHAGPGDNSATRPDVPRQLPIAPATFVGRTLELDTATRTLTTNDRYTPPIVAIHGPGGVGKSGLALRAAHAAASHYPDGQLYIDLQGSSPGVSPLSPIEALSRFLRALGVTAAEVPADEDEAAARLRSLLAARRVLLVLDNAVDIAQVRQLVPADKECGVVITSRSMLSALGDVTQLGLEVLLPEESADLLARLDPTGRLAADTSMAAQIAGMCGHLPLALRIAAARMASRPQWPLTAFVENLGDEQHRLDRLGHADLSMRACFQASYQLLEHGDAIDQAAARAFRFLGLPDGPDISLPIAARLLDTSETATEMALDRLIDAQLLESPTPGRYRMHDLLRLYAREVAAQDIHETEQHAALDKVWHCYVATAVSAGQILRPGFRKHVVDIRPEDAISLTGRDCAATWLDCECENLLAAGQQAATLSGDLTSITTKIAHVLFDFMNGNIRWRDLEKLNLTALDISRNQGDRQAEGQVLSDLGVMAWRTGDGTEAIRLFSLALHIHRQENDVLRQAMTLYNLGNAHTERGEHEQALTLLDQSLSLHRQARHASGEARTLNTLAAVNRHLGHLDLSTRQLHEALVIYSELGDVLGEGNARRHLGDVLMEGNELKEAIDCYRRAADMHRDSALPARRAWILADLGEAYRRAGELQHAAEICQEALELSRRIDAQQEQGRALWRLGCVLADLGEPERARTCWREALPIFERLGTVESAEVARLLGRDRQVPDHTGS